MTIEERLERLEALVAQHEEELAPARVERALEASSAVLRGALDEADRDTTPGHRIESER